MSETGHNNGENNGIEKVEQPHGGALNSGGTPGNKGGRPPNLFKEAMRALADRDDIRAYTERCLKGDFGPKFHMQALAYVTDRGYGKAAQPITGEDGGPLKTTVTLRLVRAKPDDDSG